MGNAHQSSPTNLELIKVNNGNNIAKIKSIDRHFQKEDLMVSLADIELQYMTEYTETHQEKILGICVNNNKKGLTILKSIITPLDFFLCENININGEYGQLLFSSCTGFDNSANKLIRAKINDNTKICYICNDKSIAAVSSDIIKTPIFKKLFDLECNVDIVMDFSNVIKCISNACEIDIRCLKITFKVDLSGIEMQCPICRTSNVIYPFEKRVKGLDVLCCVCQDKPVNVFFTGCGHINMCMDCVMASKTCQQY